MMTDRRLFLTAGLIAGALLAAPALADKMEKIHTGLVVSTTADMLVMSDPDGKNEHAHMVDDATAITIDGKPAKLPELTKGDKVKVAVGQDGKVTRIEALREKKKQPA